MHIIPIEQTARHFHEPEIHSFAEIFPAGLQSHIAQENFLHDSRNYYIKAGKEFWKYESRTRFVPTIISKTKYLDLCASTKAIHDADLVKVDDKLWIPIHRADGDNWEEIGTAICTHTEPSRLFSVMVRGNFWLFDKGKKLIYVYRRKGKRRNTNAS